MPAVLCCVPTYPLPEGAGDGVGGVDPAVGVQHVLGNVLRVHAVYGVADVLPRGHDQAEGQEEGDRGAVVESEIEFLSFNINISRQLLVMETIGLNIWLEKILPNMSKLWVVVL